MGSFRGPGPCFFLPGGGQAGRDGLVAGDFSNSKGKDVVVAEAAAGSLRVTPEELTKFIVDVLKSVGVSEEHARTTADVLVTTDTWGVNTHGVKALKGYVKRLVAGGLRAKGEPKIVKEGPGWAIIDGDSSLGMVTSTLAMKTAMRKAKACGIGFAGVRNSCHFGAAGYYANLAAQSDMIGISMANDIPSVSAPARAGRSRGAIPSPMQCPPLRVDRSCSTWPPASWLAAK